MLRRTLHCIPSKMKTGRTQLTPIMALRQNMQFVVENLRFYLHVDVLEVLLLVDAAAVVR
jgi:hypothetical protein